MLIGLAILFSLSFLSTSIGLYAVDWVIQNFITNIIVGILVLFQPEIRRVLTRVGEISIFQRHQERIKFDPVIVKTQKADAKTYVNVKISLNSLDETINACSNLASNKTGALIVIERETTLKDFVEIGTILDSIISKDLILSIFQHTSPIHDGAVIIKNNKIYAAGCFLPLTTRTDLPSSFGTRHRAGLGLAEETDAVVIIISEETGGISIVVGSRFDRNMSLVSLRTTLINIFGSRK
jgi:diadenylate cyclase